MQNTNVKVVDQSETLEQLKAKLEAERKAEKERRERIKRLEAELASMKRATTRISRYAITAQVVMANSGKTVRELAALADAAYVAAGGRANDRESEFTTGRVVSALAGVGLVKSNGVVTVIGTVTPIAPQAQAQQAPQDKGAKSDKGK